MMDKPSRAKAITNNLAAVAKSEAFALGIEWDNEPLARMHTVNCLNAAAERLRREWGMATVLQNKTAPICSTEQP